MALSLEATRRFWLMNSAGWAAWDGEPRWTSERFGRDWSGDGSCFIQSIGGTLVVAAQFALEMKVWTLAEHALFGMWIMSERALEVYTWSMIEPISPPTLHWPYWWKEPVVRITSHHAWCPPLRTFGSLLGSEIELGRIILKHFPNWIVLITSFKVFW